MTSEEKVWQRHIKHLLFLDFEIANDGGVKMLDFEAFKLKWMEENMVPEFHYLLKEEE
jgi:hypothetical protein